MGSLESTTPLKKGSLFGNHSSKKEKHPFSQRFRSSFSRLLFKKLDYVQWICAVVVFLCLVVVFQMFLPVSVLEDSEESLRAVKMRSWHSYTEEYVLDIGEDEAVFLPRISEKFKDLNLLNSTRKRFGYRKPQLALVSSSNFDLNKYVAVCLQCFFLVNCW